MCGCSKIPNAVPRRCRCTPATSLICLHANCDSPGGKVKTWRAAENNASSLQALSLGPAHTVCGAIRSVACESAGA